MLSGPPTRCPLWGSVWQPGPRATRGCRDSWSCATVPGAASSSPVSTWRAWPASSGPREPTADTHTSTEAGVYAEGTIEGQRMPCLSAVVLLLHHTRFELGPSQRESGLFLPVPSAERHVGVLRQRFDPGSMPAHVTILYPFVAPESITGAVVDDLSELLGSIEPFDFTLGDIRWFDEQVMYLAPDPCASFVDLTTRISARVPRARPVPGRIRGGGPPPDRGRRRPTGPDASSGRAPAAPPPDQGAGHQACADDPRRIGAVGPAPKLSPGPAASVANLSPPSRRRR